MKKRARIAIISLIMAFMLMVPVSCWWQFNPVKVEAEEATDVAEVVLEDRTGVLTVYAGVRKSGEQEMTALSLGSGFLIGSLDTGQYIITNYHVIDIDGYIPQYAKDQGINANNLKKVYQVIVAAGDVPVEASLVKISESNDIAILKLEEQIFNSKHLTLSSKDNVRETQSVYALGYPYVITAYGQDFASQKDEDVTIEKGAISKFPTKQGVKYIMHSAQLSEGCSGGPLVDSDGNVVAVNNSTITTGEENYYYAVQIDVVREILDTLGIQYDSTDNQTSGGTADTTSATATTSSEATTEALPETDKTGLQSAISEAEELEEADYSEDSWKNFDEKLNDAYAVNDNSAAEQTEIDDAKTQLELAMDELEEKSSFPIILVVVIIAVVIIVIVAVILLSSRKKKASKQTVSSSQAAEPSGHSTGNSSNVGGFTSNPLNFMNDYDSMSAGETSVLNEGAGDTTILNNQNSVRAVLYRKSNFENVKINKSDFYIGKERKKVDYCISNNNSISRNHAEIIMRNGVFYIIDQKSTNGTYVNGIRLNPMQETELKNGDTIQLSDEEFEFKIN